MRRGAGGGIGEVSKGRRRQRERRGRDRRQSREAPTLAAAQNHQTSILSTIIISVITTIITSISIVISIMKRASKCREAPTLRSRS